MTERVPDQIARRIAGAFAAWHTEFRGMTRRARGRFARREWQGGQEDAAVLATYRSARVLERFPRRGGESGARWRRIIALHERTLSELAGRGKGRGLPEGRELSSFGRDLFETLLPGDVRRLFDVAREQRRSHPLDLVFTSMLDWVADKPWELAFDPSRRAAEGAWGRRWLGLPAQAGDAAFVD